MSDEVLVKVENVSKKFCRSLKKSLWYGVQDIAGELFAREGAKPELRPEEFWALEDVSLELRRGECLGLIGRNGAGKSTLLKLLNGLMKPDQGCITMKGRVGALIELGAGFNPILTGRENIYVNAAVLGIPKQRVDCILDEIIDFAEIREFIDTPVQSYSSGMRVRLGFAIASQLSPNALLVDEVLAVGDRRFRIKCHNRISELTTNSSVILVSHNMNDIARICTSVAVLGEGRIIFLGETERGIELYNSLGTDGENVFARAEQGFYLDGVEIEDSSISWGDDLQFRVEFRSDINIRDCIVRTPILNQAGSVVAEWKSDNHGKLYDIRKGKNVITECLQSVKLRSGKYYLNFVLNPPDNTMNYLIVTSFYTPFIMTSGISGGSTYQV